MQYSYRPTRRALLRDSALVATGALLTPALARAAEKSPYGPFKMGIQSYSLREYSLDDALKHSQVLGLHYWESFSAHIPLTTDAAAISAMHAKLKAAKVQLLAYGVIGFDGNKENSRNAFLAAKAMGITTLAADPAPESLDYLSELVEEFKINIAIHNHGPGSRYDKLDDVVKAVKGRPTRLGACPDLGHFLRSKEDPVKVIETLGERVHGCHLKDVKDAKTFTILGQGDMDVVGVLRALKAVKFREVLALEYEENPKDPIADIRACLATVREAAAKM
jgi:sugar phosphate isomerase/epimerase